MRHPEVCESGAFELVEIKSGKSPDAGKAPKAEWIDDVAFTCMVAGRAGLDVRHVSLVLMNREYVEGESTPLWVRLDVTGAALERAKAFGAIAEAVVRATPLRRSAPTPRSSSTAATARSLPPIASASVCPIRSS